jgi:hypothetical protein
VQQKAPPMTSAVFINAVFINAGGRHPDIFLNSPSMNQPFRVEVVGQFEL